jgi:hypothetical protein
MATKNLLYNAQTRKPETLPEDEIPQAILAGTHSYEENARINVVNADGEAQSVPATQLKDALGQGYRLEGAMEAGARQYAEENSGFAGAAKVFAAKAGDEALMGIPGIVYEKTGDPYEVAKYEALKKEHALASIAGGVTGFGASLFYGGPLFKGAEAAGKGAAELAAKTAAESLRAAGMKRVAESAANSIVAKASQKAVQMGVEGAVLSAPRAVTEAALGDPEAAGESLLWGVGIGAGLGAVTGTMGGAFNKIVARRAKRAAEEADMAATRKARDVAVSGESVLDHTERKVGTVFQEVSPGSLPEAPGLSKESARALAAAKEEGIPLFSTVASDSEALRATGSDLYSSKAMTAGATMWRGEANKTFEEMQNTASRGMGKMLPEEAESGASKAEVGEIAKGAVKSKIEAQADALSGRYNELDGKVGKLAIGEDERLAVVNALDSVPKSLQASEPAGFSLASRLGDSVLESKTVHELNDTITTIKDHLSEAVRKGEYSKANILRPIKDAAVAARSAALDAAGHGAERLALDADYKVFKDFVEDVAGEGALGNIRDKAKILRKLEDIPAERLVDKMANVKNSRAMAFFKKEFPEAFEEIRKLRLREIAKVAVKDGKFQIGALLRKVKQLPKEAKALYFSAEQQRSLENLRIIYERLPPNMNPSGTANTLERLSFWKNPVDYAMQNAADAAKYAALKNQTAVDGILFAEQTMKRVAERLDKLPEALESAAKTAKPRMLSGDSGAVAMAALLAAIDGTKEKAKSRQETFTRIQEKLNDSVTQPAKTQHHTSLVASTIQDGGAPKAADAFTMKMTQALQYLHGEMPKALTPPSLVSHRPFKPSDRDMTKFERRVSTALDPFRVIDDLADGTLTREQVETVETIYPKLMGTIRMRVIQHLSENPKEYPYASRLKLSLLLGQELDPSLSPQSIQTLQAAFQEQAQGGGDGSSAGGMGPGALPPVKFSPARLGKANFSNRAATEGQLLAGRRAK